MWDGVPALQGDGCQREHWQLTGKHLRMIHKHTYFYSNIDIYKSYNSCSAIICRQRTSHREEARSTAAQAHLPVHGVVVVLALSEDVYGCYDYQVDAHAEIREGQVAHEETGDCQFGTTAWRTESEKKMTWRWHPKLK